MPSPIPEVQGGYFGMMYQLTALEFSAAAEQAAENWGAFIEQIFASMA